MHVNQPRKTQTNVITVKAPKARHHTAPASQRMAHRNTKRQKTRHAQRQTALTGW